MMKMKDTAKELGSKMKDKAKEFVKKVKGLYYNLINLKKINSLHTDDTSGLHLDLKQSIQRLQ